MKSRLPAGLLSTLLLLTACQQEKTDKKVSEKESVADISFSDTLAKAMEEARKEITTGNMSLGDGNAKQKAEITPQGDLLIGNKPVAITPVQRELLVKHRQALINVAIEGMEIGMQGAGLAKKAVGESIKSIFDGDQAPLEKKMEAETKKIEASAKVLCDQLPLLLESQQKLAEALPEFKPYATMTADDFKDCRDDIKLR